MRHVLVLCLAILAVSLAGCGGDSGGVVGSYSMDAGDFLAKMEEMMLKQMGPMLDQMPPEQVAEMKKQMLEGAKDAKVELEVKADGTFKVTAVMQGDTDVTTGTWKQEGDVITFVETGEDGKPKEGGETIKATLKDGNLMLKPDEQMPFDVVMKRK
jgi:hypothetical protein